MPSDRRLQLHEPLWNTLNWKGGNGDVKSQEWGKHSSLEPPLGLVCYMRAWHYDFLWIITNLSFHRCVFGSIWSTPWWKTSSKFTTSTNSTLWGSEFDDSGPPANDFFLFSFLRQIHHPGWRCFCRVWWSARLLARPWGGYMRLCSRCPGWPTGYWTSSARLWAARSGGGQLI